MAKKIIGGAPESSKNEPKASKIEKVEEVKVHPQVVIDGRVQDDPNSVNPGVKV